MNGVELIQIGVGVVFLIFAFGSFKNYYEGWGQQPSKIRLILISPSKATKFQQFFLLFQSMVLFAAGILCILVEF